MSIRLLYGLYYSHYLSDK